ncbi:DUF2282 domain-containing protein [Ciceribacter sp. RN22]|uniref:BufA1 family periplasmic bufferin-type metallophore n=1 Tax=Ciceribacter sp. RN22 TaxID=2954932 RepID=UPI0020930963|nr:DUF2282 domain-containing protein [Ciceribacter sp. RN22]MCO6179135.1 DUF2282 domain-containing protein [Ciceribacter sp. RN22]
MKKSIATLALTGAIASALASIAVPASAAETTEKCYGIALKGQNDCAAGKHDCAGQQSIDYDKASFKLVPAGTCTTIKTPAGMGSVTPA